MVMVMEMMTVMIDLIKMMMVMIDLIIMMMVMIDLIKMMMVMLGVVFIEHWVAKSSPPISPSFNFSVSAGD